MRKYKPRQKRITLTADQQKYIRENYTPGTHERPGSIPNIAKALELTYSQVYWFCFIDGLITPERRNSNEWQCNKKNISRPPAVYSNKSHHH